MRISKLAYRFSVAGLATLLGGCAARPPAASEPFFATEPALTTAAMQGQMARGARLDGTLHAQHFDGPGLNSLGRERLDLMLRDNESPFPVVVWVDLPEKDARTAGRRQAVETYLKEAGLTAAQFKVGPGINPESVHPVAGDLAKLSKADSAGKEEGAGATPPRGNPGGAGK